MSFLQPDARIVCEIFRRATGIDFEYRWPQLERRLERRYNGVGCSNISEYRAFLEHHPLRMAELRAFGSLVTHNETYFFREKMQFSVLVGPILDELLAGRFEAQPLRFWSCACSTGEEAYSLAIALLESGKVSAKDFTVFGSDISDQVLEIAQNGCYSDVSFREPYRVLREKYFVTTDGVSRVNDVLRSKTEFAYLNLVDRIAINHIGQFDVIFCRNVLMYFNRATQAQVLADLALALKPSGYLFLGHADPCVACEGNVLPVACEDLVVYQRIATSNGDKPKMAPATPGVINDRI